MPYPVQVSIPHQYPQPHAAAALIQQHLETAPKTSTREKAPSRLINPEFSYAKAASSGTSSADSTFSRGNPAFVTHSCVISWTNVWYVPSIPQFSASKHSALTPFNHDSRPCRLHLLFLVVSNISPIRPTEIKRIDSEFHLSNPPSIALWIGVVPQCLKVTRTPIRRFVRLLRGNCLLSCRIWSDTDPEEILEVY